MQSSKERDVEIILLLIKENPREDSNLPQSAGGMSSSKAAGRQREEIPSDGAPLSRPRPPCRAVPWVDSCPVSRPLPLRCSLLEEARSKCRSSPEPENKRRRRGKKIGFAANAAHYRLVCICIEEPQSLAHLGRAAIMFCKNVTSRSS